MSVNLFISILATMFFFSINSFGCGDPPCGFTDLLLKTTVSNSNGDKIAKIKCHNADSIYAESIRKNSNQVQDIEEDGTYFDVIFEDESYARLPLRDNCSFERL